VNATNKLLDKYAQTCYATKDKQIAERLRVTKQAVSGWRNGHAHPDAESVEKMAVAIGEPVGPWLAIIEAERARNPEAKRVWLRLAAALGTTLALALTALPHAAQAACSLPIV
jgi:transcriptional regulator with XRE-family HTH domain